MVKMYHPLKISKLEILRDHYNAKNSFIVTQQKPTDDAPTSFIVRFHKHCVCSDQ